MLDLFQKYISRRNAVQDICRLSLAAVLIVSAMGCGKGPRTDGPVTQLEQNELDSQLDALRKQKILN